MSAAHPTEPRIDLRDDVPPPWVGQRMTQDEFLALPHVKPYLEFDDGLVTQKMAAKLTHATLQEFMLTRFNQLARPRGLGRAWPELRFVSPGWAPVPDVAYYRRARVRLQAGRLPEDLYEPPDIAVEIVSPEQSVTALIKKCLRYIRLGSTVALLIDPDPETVLVFRPEQPLLLLQGDDRVDLDDVLPGLALTVREIFDELTPDKADDGDTVEDAVQPE